MHFQRKLFSVSKTSVIISVFYFIMLHRTKGEYPKLNLSSNQMFLLQRISENCNNRARRNIQKEPTSKHSVKVSGVDLLFSLRTSLDWSTRISSGSAFINLETRLTFGKSATRKRSKKKTFFAKY